MEIDLKDLPEPFLGRMLIKTIKEDADKYIKDKLAIEKKVSSEFLNKFALPTMEEVTDDQGRKAFREVKRNVPISKGVIVKMSPDCFGECFTNKYGIVGYTPVLGDTVMFIPNESQRVESSDSYHFICDCDIQGYFKAEVETIETKEVINE